jgi:hypothetical protein
MPRLRCSEDTYTGMHEHYAYIHSYWRVHKRILQVSHLSPALLRGFLQTCMQSFPCNALFFECFLVLESAHGIAYRARDLWERLWDVPDTVDPVNSGMIDAPRHTHKHTYTSSGEHMICGEGGRCSGIRAHMHDSSEILLIMIWFIDTHTYIHMQTKKYECVTGLRPSILIVMIRFINPFMYMYIYIYIIQTWMYNRPSS